MSLPCRKRQAQTSQLVRLGLPHGSQTSAAIHTVQMRVCFTYMLRYVAGNWLISTLSLHQSCVNPEFGGSRHNSETTLAVVFVLQPVFEHDAFLYNTSIKYDTCDARFVYYQHPQKSENYIPCHIKAH